MNTKQIAVLLLVTLRVINASLAADDGGPLRIGTSHSAVNSTSSIAGGANNTNNVTYSTVGGGQYNSILAGSGWSFIGGGYSNKLDDASASIIGGGEYNSILNDSYFSAICGGISNSIKGDAGYSFIGSGTDCTIHTNSAYGVIGGGGYNTIFNNAGYSVIGGGGGNKIYTDSGFDAFSTIGGGNSCIIFSNSGGGTISGGSGNVISNYSTGCTISGGGGNFIGTNSPASTIGGGADNLVKINAPYGTIGGGDYNSVGEGAAYGTVPGGKWNRADGDYSFAAGLSAYAAHDGSFVWADSSSESSTASTGINQFIVRAKGGIWLGTNTSVSIPGGHFLETQAGAYLTHGGSWSTPSDRNAKENFTPVDSEEILRKVVELPVTSWNYKAEKPDIRHVGPMAQDFHAAFGLGEDDRHMSDVDRSGVALAAIQGLHQIVEKKQSQVRELEELLLTLKKQSSAQKDVIDQFNTRFTALEKRLDKREQPLTAALPSDE